MQRWLVSVGEVEKRPNDVTGALWPLKWRSREGSSEKGVDMSLVCELDDEVDCVCSAELVPVFDFNKLWWPETFSPG